MLQWTISNNIAVTSQSLHVCDKLGIFHAVGQHDE